MSGIDSFLHEDRRFPAIKGALVDEQVHARLMASWRKDAAAHWARLADEELVWSHPFTDVLDDKEAPFYRWFSGGELNASVNCLDRHLVTKADDVAITFEGEDGEVDDWTYGRLHDRVARFAGTLRHYGVAAGDRVIIYMPLVPEVVVAMLACARIGAVHSVVFAGFSARSLADRILDTGARIVVTADGAPRGGKTVPLKANVDAATRQAPVDHVIVFPRLGLGVPMQAGRDVLWSYGEPVEAVPRLATDPLFILYTSGSTGKPKGIVHGTGGYLLWARLSTRHVFDLRPEDVYWCTADVGWITGHTYMVYGPLANGARIVMYEGAPMYPSPARWWDIIERHGVTIFYTAPTAIRAHMKAGGPDRQDLSSLRILGTVGEPINPEAWMWYHERVGGGRLPIVDTWWQTETGGIVMTSLVGVHERRPGSCGRPLPGFLLAVLDAGGAPVAGQGGDLVIEGPWPSMLQGVWGDPERFVDTYWSRGPRTYSAGDTARCDEAGDFWIMGRADDVLNVSGHRIGTMEIESALVSHAAVAEAAVVGVPDELTGEAIHAFVVLRATASAAQLRDHVAEEIGKTARPAYITIAPGLPKTRSGKIMRRLLRSIARREEITQDTSTLEDPTVVKVLEDQLATP